MAFGHERIAVTRHGKDAAVLVSADDLELLEEFEVQRDLAEYRVAKTGDDGTRVLLALLRHDLA